MDGGVIDCPQEGGSLSTLFINRSSANCVSNFRIPLVHLVGKLLSVCVIFAETNVIDLQLERTVCFVSQSKSNGVYLQIQKDVGKSKLNRDKKWTKSI